MFKSTLVVSSILFVAGSGVAWSAEETQIRTQTQAQVQDQQQIYGNQLMTEQERNEYRAKMRGAKSAEEQERIRAEHHTRMQARAKERGVTLPDEPPPQGMGKGMGPGGGMGGMGPGGGMGGGMGGGSGGR